MSLAGNTALLASRVAAEFKAVRDEMAGISGGGGSVSGVKASALPVASSLNDTDQLYVVQGGTSKVVTPSVLTTYIESRGRQMNASLANQTFTTSDTYLTGSDVTIPAGRLQAKSMYRLRLQMTKTSAAGTAGTIISVRLGTAGSTADTARATLTFSAQTAIADVGFYDIYVTWRTVGTSSVIQAAGLLDHQLAATGLASVNTSVVRVTSSAFDSTVGGLKIGCSFNGGASFAGNTDLVQAELMNLA